MIGYMEVSVNTPTSSTSHHFPQKIIKQVRWGLPPNAENDPDLWKKITTLIWDRASDLRSEWKKTASVLTMAENSHSGYSQIMESMA